MPRANIYLSEDDFELWQQLENKSELVSDALARKFGTSHPAQPSSIFIPFTGKGLPSVINQGGLQTPEKIESVAAATSSLDAAGVEPEWQEVDSKELPACCKANKPCKHWQFDGLKQAWVNELSGEVREI